MFSCYSLQCQQLFFYKIRQGIEYHRVCVNCCQQAMKFQVVCVTYRQQIFTRCKTQISYSNTNSPFYFSLRHVGLFNTNHNGQINSLHNSCKNMLGASYKNQQQRHNWNVCTTLMHLIDFGLIQEKTKSRKVYRGTFSQQSLGDLLAHQRFQRRI